MLPPHQHIGNCRLGRVVVFPDTDISPSYLTQLAVDQGQAGCLSTLLTVVGSTYNTILYPFRSTMHLRN